MPDFIVASATATQEEIDHAVSPNWRDPMPVKEPEVKTESEVATEEPVTTEETPEVETAPDSELETTQEPPQKGKGGFQKKIDKLTREKGEIQSRADSLAQELVEFKSRFEAIEARLAGKPAATEETPVKTAPDAPAKPLESDIGTKYKDWNEYNEALIDWKADRRLDAKLAERDKTAEAREAGEIQEARDSGYSETAKEFAVTVPDFNEAITAATKAGMKLPEPIINLIKELPNGPAVTYYLVKNPDEALALVEMTPQMGFVAIGRISQGLEAEVAQPVKVPVKRPLSAAPPAVRPVAGASARSSDSPTEMSKSRPDDYVRARMTQMKERDAARRY
jgi:hypothetical protein